MWRKCDLHRHTISDDPTAPSLPPEEFVQAYLDDGLDIVAVTDHNALRGFTGISTAAENRDLIVLPGIEVDTDRGHVLVVCPEVDGQLILAELIQRVPIIADTETSFNDLSASLLQKRTTTNTRFRDHMISIGAHADADNSILAAKQPPSVANQANAARQLDAVEVVKSVTLTDWGKGIKQTDLVKPLVRGSDFHPYANSERRSTWLYLPEVDLRSIRHAFATHEASISHDSPPPTGA